MSNKHNNKLLGEKALESARNNEAITSVDGHIGHLPDASYTVTETREDGLFSEQYNKFWEKTEYRKLMKDNHRFNKFDARRKPKSGKIVEFIPLEYPEEKIIDLCDYLEFGIDGFDLA